MNLPLIHISVYTKVQFVEHRTMKVHPVLSPICGDAVGLGAVTMATANRAVPGQIG